MEAFLKMKELRESLKRVPFFQAIDLLSVEEDGLLVGVSGRLAYAYRITGVDYYLFDDAAIQTFFFEMRKFLSQVPEGIIFSFLKRSREGDDQLFKRYEDSIPMEERLAREITARKIRSFEGQRFLKKEIFLFVSYLGDNETSRKNLNGSLRWKQEYEVSREIILNAESVLTSVFHSLEIQIERLTKKEVTREYYEKLNPSLSELVRFEDIFKDKPATIPAFETLRSRVLLLPPRVEHSSIYLDGYYHAALNLRTLPQALDFKMLGLFESSLPDDSEWMVTVRKLDQEKEKGSLRVKANFARANAFFRVSEDHFAREKANQYESFLHEMAERGEAVFEISLSVLVKSKDEAMLKGKREAVLKAFPKLGGAVGVTDHFEHDNLFLSHLPLQTDQNQMRFPVLSNALSFLLPVHSSWKGTEKPDILMKNHADAGLTLDLFDPSLPAKHAVMIGSTGSGKSFAANYLLSNFLVSSPKNHVVVIDVGGSYRKLAKIFNGSYLQIDCTEEYALSPFPEKKKLFPKEGSFDSDFLAFLTTLLEKMVTHQEKLTSSELRILEKSIVKAYERFPEDGCPLLGDIERVLRDYSLGDREDRERAYGFSKNLSIWTEGRFGKLLNQKGNLSLDARFIVFDLAKLSHHPELQSILFFVIRSAISRKLSDTSLRKVIVIDEGWRFFNDDVGARLVEELYRTARKANALVLSISQSPEDFLESKASTAILSNSYVKYILKLQKGHELLQKFDLNPNEIKACQDLEAKPGIFSEVFIKFLNRSVTAKIEPSPLDYWIATTDPEDLNQEESEKAGHEDASELECLILLSEKYPRGMRWQKESNPHA